MLSSPTTATSKASSTDQPASKQQQQQDGAQHTQTGGTLRASAVSFVPGECACVVVGVLGKGENSESESVNQGISVAHKPTPDPAAI